MVRVLRFLTFFINHNLTVFSSNYETFGIGDYTFDVESFTRAFS